MAIKLMYIANEPQIAHIAEKNGVDRIFVDLEVRGKADGMYLTRLPDRGINTGPVQLLHTGGKLLHIGI